MFAGSTHIETPSLPPLTIRGGVPGSSTGAAGAEIEVEIVEEREVAGREVILDDEIRWPSSFSLTKLLP